MAKLEPTDINRVMSIAGRTDISDIIIPELSMASADSSYFMDEIRRIMYEYGAEERAYSLSADFFFLLNDAAKNGTDNPRFRLDVFGVYMYMAGKLDGLRETRIEVTHPYLV